MINFVTSDTHFFHQKILKFCSAVRRFETVDEMNERIISDWNSVVQPEDTVWHLGDFSYKAKKQQIQGVFDRLNGHKHLIQGNHDHSDTRKLPWDSVKMYHEIEDGDRYYVLMHYPIEEWNFRTHGSIHLHGHVHTMPPHPDHPSRLTVLPNRFDVGVDRAWNPGFFGPLPLKFFGGMGVNNQVRRH